MSTAPIPGNALDVHASARRASELVRERERLMQRIAARKAEISASTDRACTSVTGVMSKMGALKERVDAIRGELRALFDELLAPGRGSKRARRVVADIRAELVLGGVLDAPTEDDALGEDAQNDDEARWDLGGPRGGGEEVSSATPRGAAKGQETLRGVFRRLAISMHPDRATNDIDRVRRTDLMKDVTRAYDDGDIARLLELEVAWTETSQTTSVYASADDTERCRRLELEVRALRAQLRALDRERRELRKLEANPLFGDPMVALMSQCEREVAELEGVRDFVASFRDGKISLKRFEEGPPVPEGSEDDFDEVFGVFEDDPFGGDLDDEEEDPLQALLRLLDGASPPPPPPRGSCRRKKRR